MQSFSTAIEARGRAHWNVGARRKFEQRKSAIHLFAFPSPVLLSGLFGRFQSSFFFLSLFFFGQFPGKESGILSLPAFIHIYMRFMLLLLLRLLWLLLLVSVLFGLLAESWLLSPRSCVQCTCQSLIEGKIAVWLADSVPPFLRECVCVCPRVCVWMRHIFPATWQKSLQRGSNKVKAKEKKLRGPSDQVSEEGYIGL